MVAASGGRAWAMRVPASVSGVTEPPRFGGLRELQRTAGNAAVARRVVPVQRVKVIVPFNGCRGAGSEDTLMTTGLDNCIAVAVRHESGYGALAHFDTSRNMSPDAYSMLAAELPAGKEAFSADTLTNLKNDLIASVNRARATAGLPPVVDGFAWSVGLGLIWTLPGHDDGWKRWEASLLRVLDKVFGVVKVATGGSTAVFAVAAGQLEGFTDEKRTEELIPGGGSHPDMQNEDRDRVLWYAR